MRPSWPRSPHGRSVRDHVKGLLVFGPDRWANLEWAFAMKYVSTDPIVKEVRTWVEEIQERSIELPAARDREAKSMRTRSPERLTFAVRAAPVREGQTSPKRFAFAVRAAPVRRDLPVCLLLRPR